MLEDLAADMLLSKRLMSLENRIVSNSIIDILTSNKIFFIDLYFRFYPLGKMVSVLASLSCHI